MEKLAKFSDSELAAELRRRKEAKEKPPQLADVNIRELRAVCQEYIDELASTGYEMKDGEHWIYEAALEAIFGKGIWTYIRAVSK